MVAQQLVDQLKALFKKNRRSPTIRTRMQRVDGQPCPYCEAPLGPDAQAPQNIEGIQGVLTRCGECHEFFVDDPVVGFRDLDRMEQNLLGILVVHTLYKYEMEDLIT